MDRILSCFLYVILIGFSANSFSQVTLFSDDFESGFGNWINVSSGDSDQWTLGSLGTPSSSTGPHGGASSSYYVFLETSSDGANASGDSAILQGPVISGFGIKLRFEYHMYGSDVGSLAVDVYSDGSWINDVWLISGQQQSTSLASYISADVDLSSYAVTQIRFRATAVGGYMGDIAIDNVVIEEAVTGPVAPTFLKDEIEKPDAREGSVYTGSILDDVIDVNSDLLSFRKVSGPEWLSVAADGSLSGTPLESDVAVNSFIVEVSDGSFTDNAMLKITVKDKDAPLVLYSNDFELGFGDWVNILSEDNKNWSRHTGSTPSVSTGPPGGASGSSYYVYLETSSGGANSNGDSAILLGPVLLDTNIYLDFSYHMYGSDIGSLSVDGYSNGAWTNNVWTVSGEQHTGVSTTYTKVSLELSSYGFTQLRFRATAVGGYMGDMALDDIKITAINPATLDSDNDGVFNPDDLCPGTNDGESVNSEGCSLSQIDTDNDGAVDSVDEFPLDPMEWLDTDRDGIGNNADDDDDNDGVLDAVDTFPLDGSEWVDTDNDGIGNNGDNDDDGDGVSDIEDAFPLDATESVDTDRDGIGNNIDVDDDNDGVLDTNDQFPLDADESIDTDGDGIGNNMDLDDDNDLLTDHDEINSYHTNPLSADSDFDGMTDGWEVLYNLQPNVNDADEDLDSDSYTNLQEFNASTDPADPNSIPYVPIDDLSLSTYSSCALINNEITCWGLIDEHPTPDNLIAPSRVAHNRSSGICALQGNDVLCWGNESTMITDLQINPINDAVALHVATMTNTACVITLSGDINCWGGGVTDLMFHQLVLRMLSKLICLITMRVDMTGLMLRVGEIIRLVRLMYQVT
ncbi:hypothetical protein BTJ40_09390 [Microbulbifer sp. A4B17]|uniref:hypothetical protein n=1 Tax=Microbulbifer sp. A4B17 TaxID=359370 RepID=UPI000D52D9B0|nr:hypothetical protein [Microbulbifer sp. A4B17]AWF81008.1 hypothetical protein BTJ40_09390 [Microbulbifer sp. A4B17]